MSRTILIEIKKGDKFDGLTVIKELGRERVDGKLMPRRARFECHCGAIKEMMLINVTRGTTTSCGCARAASTAKAHTKHGLRSHAAYHAWKNMRRRCRTEPNYIELGITVCDEWNSVANFLEWASGNGFKKGLELDRKDTLGNYEPENCRFVTRITNTQNTRRCKYWHIKGKVYESAREAAESLGVGYSTIQTWVNGQRGNAGRDDCWCVHKYPVAT